MKNKNFAFIIIFTMFINACGNITQTVTQTPVISTQTPSSTVTPTVTPEPIDVKLYKPQNIYDPKDPSLPELIIPSDDGMKLDPNWVISKIEYTYDWWGYSTEPILGYQKIEYKNNQYYLDNEKILSKKVDDFINSLSNLHPAQSILTGIWHTDDYPTWQVELTGNDGNRILVYSSSNENPGYGPWNVIYNGRIYVEYGGLIGPAIGKLFWEEDDKSYWEGAGFGDYHPKGLMAFSTVGWTNQLWDGFDGLLPVANSFHYYIDSEKEEIRGYVRGRYSIGGFGNLVIGNVTNLHSVKINIEGKDKFCSIEKVESDDTYSEEWTFLCKLSEIENEQRYRYPVELIFTTDKGQRFITDGSLYGILGSQNKFWIIPPAEEIQMAINSNTNAQALLKSSTLYVSLYNGKLQLSEDTSPVISGQFSIIGEAEIDSERIKYSVFTPFIVENQRFTKFTLTEQDLKDFLYDVMKSPITRRIMTYYPDVTLNLWYDKEKNKLEPEIPFLEVSAFISPFQTELTSCTNKDLHIYPSKNKPYRVFTFNSNYLFNPWSGFRHDAVFFLLTEDKTLVSDISLSQWSNLDNKGLDTFSQLQLPSQLNIFNIRPFLDIKYSTEDMELWVVPHYEATQDEINIYESSLALLPSPIEEKRAGRWYIIKNLQFVVNEDGTISAVSCK